MAECKSVQNIYGLLRLRICIRRLRAIVFSVVGQGELSFSSPLQVCVSVFKIIRLVFKIAESKVCLIRVLGVRRRLRKLPERWPSALVLPARNQVPKPPHPRVGWGLGARALTSAQGQQKCGQACRN